MAASPEELALHRRLLNGDESASGALFARYLNPLIDLLEAVYSDIARDDAMLVGDAVADVLLDYIERPARYDPSGCSLQNYFYMAASGDILNEWQKRQRLHRREINVANIEDSSDEGEKENLVGFARRARNQRAEPFGLNVPDAVPQILNRLVAGELWAQVQTLVPDATERRILWLMMAGFREVAPYSELLGLEEQPIEAQREAVNKLKEKLKTRLKRNLDVKSLGYDWD